MLNLDWKGAEQKQFKQEFPVVAEPDRCRCGKWIYSLCILKDQPVEFWKRQIFLE